MLRHVCSKLRKRLLAKDIRMIEDANVGYAIIIFIMTVVI